MDERAPSAAAPRAASPRLVVVADDLTGAVETAALLVAPDGTRPRVLLDAAPADLTAALAEPGAIVLDADLRHLDHAGARDRLGALLASIPDDAEVLVKVDSLLRGPLAAIAEALAARSPLLCTAVPATSRAVVGGVVRVAGTPMHETDAWHAEPVAAPRSVVDAVAPAIATRVPLDVVRGDGLVDALEAADGIAVVDAETDADLAGIVVAAPGALVGAAGLAGAWALVHGHGHLPAADATTVEPRRDDPLALIGTASSEAAEQVDRCTAAGVATLRPAADAIHAAEPTTGEPAIVAVPREPSDPAVIEAGFARLATSAAGDRDLVVSGGATARAVLAALGIRILRPVAELHHGAVVSHAGTRRVVTRPGSYGDPSSLQAALACLASARQEHP